MLDALIAMHQKYWNRRGQAGAFSTEFFKNFHRCLISSRFEAGEIQLLEISNSDGPIGYLYNFIYDNQVLYYQSGLNYKSDNKFRPGIICHFMAVKHNLNENHNSYNFLGGDARYKKSLSTNQDNLYYITIGRKNMKQRIEHFVLTLKKYLRN